MAFDDRLLFLLLGVGIGFVIGYLTRLAREMKDIKEELDEVDTIVKENLGNDHESNEDGFMRNPWVANVAILLVVGLTAWASFVSQKASNDVRNSQEQSEKVVACLQTTLGDVLIALDERSTYTRGLAEANTKLQKAQSKFFEILRHEPPYSLDRREQAVEDYVDALNKFLMLSAKNKKKISENEFPTIQVFSDCLPEDAQ